MKKRSLFSVKMQNACSAVCVEIFCHFIKHLYIIIL